MRKHAGIFVIGLLLGAFSGGATALFSTAHLKRARGAHRHSMGERLSRRTAKEPDPDQGELGTWSGRVPIGRVSGQSLTSAPLGWY
jgi:hypothetical protein